MTAQPSSPVDRSDQPDRAPVVATVPAPAETHVTLSDRFGHPPRGILLLGLTGAVLMALGGYGAGGVLVRDPLLTNSALGFWRYGHGREIATVLVYLASA